VRPIKSREKLESFKKQRITSREVLRQKLYQDALEVRRLDTHVDEFLRLIREDARHHDTKELLRHGGEFEREIQAELDHLMEMARGDLDLFLRILGSLHRFKTELKRLNNQEASFRTFADAEIRYADALSRSAQHKLEALNKVFRRIQHA